MLPTDKNGRPRIGCSGMVGPIRQPQTYPKPIFASRMSDSDRASLEAFVCLIGVLSIPVVIVLFAYFFL